MFRRGSFSSQNAYLRTARRPSLTLFRPDLSHTPLHTGAGCVHQSCKGHPLSDINLDSHMLTCLMARRGFSRLLFGLLSVVYGWSSVTLSHQTTAGRGADCCWKSAAAGRFRVLDDGFRALGFGGEV